MDSKVEELKRQQKKQQEQARKREGEVTIDYSGKNKGKDKPARGEYVDYVEVKD